MFTDEELKPFGYASGNYLINCACGDLTALADKRSLRCYSCAAKAFVSALRLRVEMAEKETRLLRQQLEGEKEAYALSDKIATERMHKAEKDAAKAYLEGQIDMRKLAADTVIIGCPTSEEEAVKRYGANWRYDAVRNLPIKERP